MEAVVLVVGALAGIIIVTVAFLTSTTAGIVVAVFFVLYQQLENHLLQPLVYGRTVELSPLAVLIAVLIGAEVAGVLGALAAIPVAAPTGGSATPGRLATEGDGSRFSSHPADLNPT